MRSELCSGYLTPISLSFFEGVERLRDFYAANRFNRHAPTVFEEIRHVLT